MANITLNYKGLTGQGYTLVIDDGQTMSQLLTAIAADEGLSSAYYTICERNTRVINDINNSGDTLASLGLTTGDYIDCCAKNQADKENNQLMRLEIAQEKRQADGDDTATFFREWNTYDVLALARPYTGNSLVDDSTTINPLVPHRPWVSGAGAVVEDPNDAVTDADTALQIWYDGADTATYIPSATDEGQITQWTDKSDYAHNANSTGSSKPTYENTTPQNGYGYVEFDGINDYMDINPFTNTASAAGFSIFVVARALSLAGTSYLTTTRQDDLQIYHSGGTWNVRMDDGTNTLTGTGTNAGDTTDFHIFALVYDGTAGTDAANLVFRYDLTTDTLGFAGTRTTTTNSMNNVMVIGADSANANNYTGYVAEIVIFDRTLNSVEIGNVENYLNNKWALGL